MILQRSNRKPDEHGAGERPALWESEGISDPGLIRATNEDYFLERPDAGVFAVADGMGGHAAGEVASRLAVDTVESHLTTDSGAASLDTVSAAMARANHAILEAASRDPARAGMGTTLTVAVLHPDGSHCIVGHVGDSRLYRLREGQLEQLTTDHTVVQREIDAGAMADSAAREHPARHLLTRALGTVSGMTSDVFRADLQPEDILLLCSDGLTGMINSGGIQAILLERTTLGERAKQLVEAANAHGGEDNITVVLVRRRDDALQD